MMKMLPKEICFDMDGTIADFYGVENWLQDLQNESTRPYDIARPLVNMVKLDKILSRLQANGYTVKIISWTAKAGTADFNQRVRLAKINWLKKQFNSFRFDNVYVIPYGEPKEKYGNGILFDDEKQNRDAWNGIAYDVQNILEILQNL